MAEQILLGGVGAAAVLYGPSFFAKHSLYEFKFAAIGLGSATFCGFCVAVLFGASISRGQKTSIFRDLEFYKLWGIFALGFSVASVPIGLCLDGAFAVFK